MRHYELRRGLLSPELLQLPAPTRQQQQRPHVLLVSRQRSGKRHMLNEAQLCDLIKGWPCLAVMLDMHCSSWTEHAVYSMPFPPSLPPSLSFH